MNSELMEIDLIFKLPINFNSNKKEINLSIVQDLELIKSNDSNEICIYNYILNPSNCFGDLILNSFSKYYSTFRNTKWSTY